MKQSFSVVISETVLISDCLINVLQSRRIPTNNNFAPNTKVKLEKKVFRGNKKKSQKFSNKRGWSTILVTRATNVRLDALYTFFSEKKLCKNFAPLCKTFFNSVFLRSGFQLTIYSYFCFSLKNMKKLDTKEKRKTV
jgi:hypothetical protein